MSDEKDPTDDPEFVKRSLEGAKHIDWEYARYSICPDRPGWVRIEVRAPVPGGVTISPESHTGQKALEYFGSLCRGFERGFKRVVDAMKN